MVSDVWLKRLYATIVVGLLVWPVPHWLLTDAVGSDPWKNLGLAMYATNFDVRIGVRTRTPDGRWPRLRPEGATFDLIQDFVERRRARGRLHEPDRLAAALAREVGTDAVRISIANQVLDAERGLVEMVRPESFEYVVTPDGEVLGGRVTAAGGASP